MSSKQLINQTHKNNSFALLIDEMQDNLADYPAQLNSTTKNRHITASAVIPIPGASDYIVEHIDIQDH